MDGAASAKAPHGGERGPECSNIRASENCCISLLNRRKMPLGKQFPAAFARLRRRHRAPNAEMPLE
jgi:hypothetical protein